MNKRAVYRKKDDKFYGYIELYFDGEVWVFPWINENFYSVLVTETER